MTIAINILFSKALERDLLFFSEIDYKVGLKCTPGASPCKLKVFEFYFESLAGISPSPGPLILEYALVGVNSTIAYSRRRKFCESENR